MTYYIRKYIFQAWIISILARRILTMDKSRYFKEVLDSFLEKFLDLEAMILSDSHGFIIAGEKRKDSESNIELVSVLSSMITPILERIRNEFAFKKFGTGSFDTEEYRLVFISVDEERVLSLIFNGMASIEKISPYTYFLAEKLAQILNVKDGDQLQLEIPDFEDEAKRHARIKRQIIETKEIGAE